MTELCVVHECGLHFHDIAGNDFRKAFSRDQVLANSFARCDGFELCHYRHQCKAGDDKIYPNILRDSCPFINSPPSLLQRIIIAQKFQPEPCRAIQNEHECECRSRFCDRVFPPEQIQQQTHDKRISRRVELRRMNRQAAVFTRRHFLFLFRGQKSAYPNRPV